MNSKSPVIWTWLVAEDLDRADRAILRALEEGLGSPSSGLPPLSRNQLQRLIAEGKVTANQTPLKANTKLTASTQIQISFPPPAPLDLVPENRPLDILFEDSHLLVINKPQGLTVHPSTTQTEGTLVHALLHHVKDLSGIGGKMRPGIVHRIDKNTSGALVITKTDQAHQKLSETFSRHEIDRAYWAFCYGSPPISVGAKPIKIESLIGRSPSDRKKMSMTVKEGRTAISYYTKIKDFQVPNKKPFASWLEVTLETGRTHQVRVHLTGLGHSLLGDPTYGAPTHQNSKWLALPTTIRKQVESLPGQALHARVLGFQHPITQEKLRFEAPLPDTIQNLLNSLNSFCSEESL